jgi:tRNA threonylcarbamoyladenosine biosynthesis protein TsaE
MHSSQSEHNHSIDTSSGATARVFDIHEELDLRHVVGCVIDLLLHYAKINQSAQTVVITLSGDLGAGKTTYTKTFARYIGLTDMLTSPTFVIQKSYALPQTSIINAFNTLVHIDAYRLHDAGDLRKISFESLLAEGTRNVICIEWPEIVSDIIPQAHIALQFEHREGTMRKVTVTSNL